ncbi:MAG: helix-turn-helix domain-containing protein [Acetobacteraceae bacterium]
MPRVSRASAATNLPASRIAGGVASVERALSVVAAFAASTSPLTLAELARATGLYNSTVLRLLVSLERGGYVVRGGDGRYGLGTMAFRLGLAYERSHGFEDASAANPAGTRATRLRKPILPRAP